MTTATVISSQEYREARRTMLHAMQYLRGSYSAFNSDSVDAYNLSVDGLQVAYNSWKEYR